MRKLKEAVLYLKNRLRYCVRATEVEKDVVEIAINLMEKQIPIPLEEWNEDYGDCLWWKFPVEESPYCGSPLDQEWQEKNYDDYYTHFTRLIIPELSS